jgi:diguanylate cyclase (GGDEF)-like protein
MFHVDVLSGYLICGAGSLVGAGMLRIAEPHDARARAALRICGWGFVVLGLGLLPAGLGAAAAHAAVQLSLALGSLAGLVLIAAGLGRLQGRHLAAPAMAVWIVAGAIGTAVALQFGALAFGVFFAIGLTLHAGLVLWLTRGFVVSPRDPIEGALGAALVVLALTTAMRLAFTLAYEGPPRHDLMYVPSPLSDLLAALYGVLPMIVATLLLSLVNSRLRQQLRTRAITDELTGTMTRRALRELAPALIEEQLQRQREMAVLMLDLDRFKHINDNYGHHTGDAVLQMAAALLRDHLRTDALLARYGGEEFVAIVPVEDLPSARRVAERLRHAVETADWRARLQLAEAVTVSVGVAIVGPAEALDAVLKRADEALYRAKRDGRNQCQFGLTVAGSL